MIYTITFNPSLDYIVFMDNFQVGEINRTEKEIINPGGKGINVSIVLRNLDHESVALGFVAGFTGKEIERLVNEDRITSDFIHLKNGFSRVNVKIQSEGETAVNGMGPHIEKKDIDELYSKLSKIKEGDTLVLAGSIPTDLPETIYMDIMKFLEGKDINIVVDATGKLLFNVLKYKPFLVKPNNEELGQIYGTTIESRDDIIFYAKKMQESGARNVLVSRASEGAILITEEGQIFEHNSPEGRVINSVGAGDSMVAGFLEGYSKNKNYEEAFYSGLCAGSASAYSVGFADKEKVNELLTQLNKTQYLK